MQMGQRVRYMVSIIQTYGCPADHASYDLYSAARCWCPHAWKPSSEALAKADLPLWSVFSTHDSVLRLCQLESALNKHVGLPATVGHSGA